MESNQTSKQNTNSIEDDFLARLYADKFAIYELADAMEASRKKEKDKNNKDKN